MSAPSRPTSVVALAASAELGGTERVFIDFAARAFEHEIALGVITPRDGPLLSVLRQLGVPTAIQPAPDYVLRGSQRAAHLWSAPIAAAGLARWARRVSRHEYWSRADAVYSISFKTHLATAFKRDRPVVWHLHEFPPRLTGAGWRLLSRRVPARLIANSEAAGRAWAASDPNRLTVIPNGVDLDRFKPRTRTFWVHDRLRIPRGHRIIGMPAVFARWKGQIEVIDAFRALRAEIPNVHLVLVGGSIYDTVAERRYGDMLVERIARERRSGGGSAHPTVHLLEFQRDIERVYPEFDLAVHYSLRPEPFGRVILEAMACGVPVLAAGEGGPLEILAGDVGGGMAGGWLVPPRDPPALYAALRAALTTPPAELHRVGLAGRERAETHFSARGFARGVANVIRDAARATMP